MIRDIVMTQSGNSTIPLTDINAANVSLLLNGDGTNGAQNNTFIDSSVNNATITRYGDTTQGSFSPFGNSWSNYFDGTGDYLILPSSTNYAFGTGDFTIECWINVSSVTTQYPIILSFQTPNQYFGISKLLNSTTTFKLAHNLIGSSTYTESNTIFDINRWYHVAVSRNGTTLTYFVDGINTISVVDSGSIGSNTQMMIGYSPNYTNTYYFNGNISNLRIVKGTALYTSNFTPSTTPLTAVAGTVLLTCNSNNFKDNSVNNATISVYGDTKVEKGSPFPEVYDKAVQGASAYFDGTGDYLSLPNSTAFSFGTGSFTIECWYNQTSKPTGYPCIVNFNGLWAPNVFNLQVNTNDVGNKFCFSAYNSGANILVSLTVPSFGTWNHVAVVRNGNTLMMFVNGILEASTTYTSDISGSAASTLEIGGQPSVAISGYTSNLRILKGTALYTSNFTPPTSPLTAIANTVLLLKGDNAGIVDATGKNNLVTYGNAQISTAVKKYGTGSMYFDGTGDWLLSNPLSSNALGAGDLTVECWVNVPTISGGYAAIVADNSYGAGSNGWAVYQNGAAIEVWQDAGNIHTISSALNVNTWIHIAWVRIGTSSKVYINGIASSLVSNSTAYSGTQYWVGARGPTSGSYPFTGYIDDLRITKGIARYPLNIMPTQALPLPTATAAGDDPYWASVSLLLNGDGTNGSTVFTDLSSSPKAITTYGNAQISTTTKKFGTGSMYFDGTGDYLAIPNNPAFSFGTGDFTVECWSYTVSATAWCNFISTGTNSDGSNLGWKVGRNSTNNILSFALRTGNDYTNYNGTAITWNNNTWYHFAAVRSGTTLTLYWDGVVAGVFTGMSAEVNTGSGGVSVGCRYASTTAEIMEFHNGYIDDLRVTKGVARYTANFTPPTQSLPLSGGNPLDPYSAHVSLLLNGDGANGSTTFTDLSLSPTTVTAYGNAQVSTTTKKYGTGAMYFDGSGDYLTISQGSFNAGTGDFTIEAWVHPTTYNTYNYIYLSSSSDAGLLFGVSDSQLRLRSYFTQDLLSSATGTIPALNTWSHVAVSRANGITNIFLNGISVASGTITYSFVANSSAFVGGSSRESFYFTGYIDDLRITKGIARYTVNFTPPTQSLSL